MILKRISIFILATAISIVSFAQDAKNNSVSKNSDHLGINAGFTTGLGLSFRHWHDKFGVQITAIPLKTDNLQFFSAGITGLYSINNHRNFRHFLYLGNHMIFYTRKIRDYDWSTGTSTYHTKETQQYNAGFGYGIELGTKVRFNFMIGYAGYNLLDENFDLLPTAEIGLYFHL